MDGMIIPLIWCFSLSLALSRALPLSLSSSSLSQAVCVCQSVCVCARAFACVSDDEGISGSNVYDSDRESRERWGGGGRRM